ncbi:MAG: hypothetical protein K9K93_07315, partial [Acholeplasmataceae bacterium]|nr:hypothetical protein [Acholeplasmataceae bacterium]
LGELDDFSLVLSRPNDYLFRATSVYLDTPLMSNGYTFMTDSVPFLQLVLKGSVELYSPSMNSVADLSLAILKMIEYGVSPSFVVTAAEGHLLRYTNYESLQSTEYALWRDIILDVYHEVSSVLDEVSSARMERHEVVMPGVVRIIYDNGVIIYVNHTDQDVTYGTVTVAEQSAKAVRP